MVPASEAERAEWDGNVALRRPDAGGSGAPPSMPRSSALRERAHIEHLPWGLTDVDRGPGDAPGQRLS